MNFDLWGPVNAPEKNAEITKSSDIVMQSFCGSSRAKNENFLYKKTSDMELRTSNGLIRIVKV